MLLREHCSIRIMLILPLSQSRSLNISHQSRDSVGACKDGEGWNKCICGQRAGDRVRSTRQVISTTALQFVVWLSHPFIGYGLTWWPIGERWTKAWSICLGFNKAVVMVLLGCLRGMNAFITVLPLGGWVNILRFFLFYFFWRQQKNKWDVKGHREHFLQSQELKRILLTHSLIFWWQDSLVRWCPKSCFYFLCSSRAFWIYTCWKDIFASFSLTSFSLLLQGWDHFKISCALFSVL